MINRHNIIIFFQTYLFYLTYSVSLWAVLCGFVHKWTYGPLRRLSLHLVLTFLILYTVCSWRAIKNWNLLLSFVILIWICVYIYVNLFYNILKLLYIIFLGHSSRICISWISKSAKLREFEFKRNLRYFSFAMFT